MYPYFSLYIPSWINLRRIEKTCLVLYWKRVECPFQVEKELLTHLEDLVLD